MIIAIVFICIICLQQCQGTIKGYSEVEECRSDRCQLPYCYCSNQSIPGDLTARNTPQFISISINGPLEEKTYALLEDLFFSKKYINPDGCPISGTIFLKSHAETNYCLLKQVLRHGNIELGITSNSSECPTIDCRVKEKNDRSPFVSWRSYRFYNETIDYRRTIEKLTGIRASSIVGYRSPNYEVNNKQLHWQMLREHQFVYDSTLITREWPSSYSNQQQPAPMTWPHTMDFGTNYDCSQGCYTQSFPGLWTIPIHMYQDFEGKNCTTIGSSHCRVPRTSEKFFEYLKYNLNRHLYSNHAPFLMAFDNYWINEPYTTWRLEGLKLFIEHTLRHHSNDVYFVRLIDIINWMKNPVDLERMKHGYLSDIAHRAGCQAQMNIQVKQQCINGEEIDPNKKDEKEKERSLLMIFDTVAEPLFRSNIVYYTTLSFLLLIVITLIYDRIFKS